MTSKVSQWRVLVSAPYILPVLNEYRPLLEEHSVEAITAPVRERLNEDELLPLVGDIDGVICGDDRFTSAVLRAAPKLKVISKWGTGIDSIDSETASKLGIAVYNTPGAFTDPVADTVMGYVLAFARKLPWLDQDIRAGRWAKRDGIALHECILGVIGVGAVGKAVVHRAKAFGMGLIGCDIVPVSRSFIKNTGIEMTSLDDLLSRADFVSLNCTLNPTSHHLIGARELGLMKSSAHLINTCRGPVVDEPALVEALRSGRIAGAGLDVFEEEPLSPNNPLRTLSNCLLAPHNANSSPVAWQRVHENTIGNLLKGLAASK